MAANALESNPEVMNKLLAAVGVPEKYKVRPRMIFLPHNLFPTKDPRCAGDRGGKYS